MSLSLLLVIALSCCAVGGQRCVKIDNCKCEMSDNSGIINLKSLASSTGQPRWEIPDGVGWIYRYNPCVGFNSVQFSDLAVHQISETDPTQEYNLGIQSSEDFVFSFTEGTSVMYSDDPDYPVRKSKVVLECVSELDFEHELQFIGELIVTEYDFILRGPCACPGLCDDFGVLQPTTTTSAATTTTRSDVDTTTTSTDGGNPDPVQTGLNWNQVGADIVSLIFHDLILVVVIGCVIAIAKFLLGYTCYCTQPTAQYKGQTDTYDIKANTVSQA
ncbi:unnamed protein product [Clavelina lepadiformis]|uniref:Uncharacterized protein n=1 Tax=Clavelina lepadiformis TaxID=159417 RepID=A0ABP0FQR8_CLALP